MRLHTRLGASICLTVFSIITIALLLTNSGVTDRLQRIALGTSINHLSGSFWGWAAGDDDDYLRVVVFGDSWAEVTSEDALIGKGKGWAGVLCELINCTSHISFAASQPAAAYPASPPTGAMTSNEVYITSTRDSPGAEKLTADLLPDLTSQVHEYIAVQPSKPLPRDMVFAVSFGFWDIYNFACLEYDLAQNMTDQSVDELVAQLSILYSHYRRGVLDATNDTTPDPAPFRVVIPKLFDPTLVPGWISQRAAPPGPATVAEQQKQAVYLTERWNSRLENKLGSWVTEYPNLEANVTEPANESGEPPAAGALSKGRIIIEKYVFYYDLPKYLVDIMVEHQLEAEGLTDASGLGKGKSPFQSVSEPCLKEGSETEEALIDRHGKLVCGAPENYLFWDDFNLGKVANEAIGTEVARMVKKGQRMRQ